MKIMVKSPDGLFESPQKYKRVNYKRGNDERRNGREF